MRLVTRRLRCPGGSAAVSPTQGATYLYSDGDIAQLLRSALDLPPAGGLRPWTYHTLLGLLSVAGLRVGGAIRLMDADVDLQEGLLTIRGTKFGKSRLVPIHSSTLGSCNSTAPTANPFSQAMQPRHSSSPVAVIISTSVMCIERSIACRAKVGLRGATASHGPRLHDFSAPLRGPDAVALVPLRRGCRATVAGAVDLFGPCPYRRHLLVSERLSGADGTGGRAS